MKKLEVGTEVVFLDSEVTREIGIVGEKGMIESNSGKRYPYSIRYGSQDQWGYFDEGEFKAIEDAVTSEDGYEKQRTVNHPTHKVIYNKPATIVILGTGEKGITRCLPEDTYNEDKGYQIALLKAQTKAKEKESRKLQKAHNKLMSELEIMYLQIEELMK